MAYKQKWLYGHFMAYLVLVTGDCASADFNGL